MVQRDRRRPPARLLARMNLYVPLEHVVQQGRGIFGRRDAPKDRVEQKQTQEWTNGLLPALLNEDQNEQVRTQQPGRDKHRGRTDTSDA
jgi:hypothetical protein